MRIGEAPASLAQLFGVARNSGGATFPEPAKTQDDVAARSATNAAADIFYAAHSDQRVAIQEIGQAEPESASSRAREFFLAYAQKSPAELIRDQILESLGYTEESLAQLPPEERAAVEDKIRKLIEEKMRMAMREKGLDPDGSTAPAAQTDVLV